MVGFLFNWVVSWKGRAERRKGRMGVSDVCCGERKTD